MIYADMVIHGGKIATVDKHFSFCQAVAIKDGFIIELGTNALVLSYVGEHTQIIDLNGKVMLPAANDAHMHAILTGLTMQPTFLDLKFPLVKSIKDIQTKIALAVKNTPKGTWILGMGFMENLLEECQGTVRKLSQHDLNVIAPDHPVMLNDFGMHTALVNAKALEIAGIHESDAPLLPEVGSIEKDPITGKLTGIIREWGAQHMIGRCAPVLTDKVIETCILTVQAALNAQGITSHTDILGIGGDHLMGGSWSQRGVEIYEQLSRAKKLTARVSVNIFPALSGIQSYECIINGLDKMHLPNFSDKNWVKADCIKLFSEGMPWFREVFGRKGRSSFPGTSAIEQAAEIRKTIVEIHRRGWQIGTHAIGGRSIDIVLDAYIEAQQRYPRAKSRHFLIHADDLSLDNVAQMAKFKIGCSTQPVAANLVAGFMSKLIGKDLFNWQEYTKRGVIVAGGSDANCFSLNWREGVQFAVTRITPRGESFCPELAMSLENAIRMYTINGAWQENRAHLCGSIEIGKLADFQILSEDIFTVPKNKIGQIKIAMTLCNGKIVYTQKGGLDEPIST